MGPAVSRFGSNYTLIAVILITVSLGGRLALLNWIPIPEPAIQDEFSYLLAADTFASGRLTNPTHPLWAHFETSHEMMRPSYQSKYPPAQGLFMAFGQIVLGHPWYGVWLSTGLMIAAIYWALLGWLPARWALLGGVIALLKMGVVSYFNGSYWGGAIAAAAGALVIGAIPRLRMRATFRTGLIFAAGLAFLANSRPLEGALLGIGALTVILLKVPVHQLWRPMALVLLPTALWMLYYDYRTTGNVFDTPYALHHRQFDITTPFLWDRQVHPQPPNVNSHLTAIHRFEFDNRAKQTSLSGRFINALLLSNHYLGYPLTLVVLALLAFVAWRRTKHLILLAALFPMLLLFANYIWIWPHYAAPAAAAIYIITMLALRKLFVYQPMAIQCFVAFLLSSYVWQYRDPESQRLPYLDRTPHHAAIRNLIYAQLKHAEGKKVIFVTYLPGHYSEADINKDWIFNRANIDGAETIWALTLDPEKDNEVMDFYPDRQYWRMIVDGDDRIELSHFNRKP